MVSDKKNVSNSKESEFKKEQIIKDILSNDEYILWLINFFNRHRWCSNEVCFGGIDFEEKSNLEKLEYFCNGIARYASTNYIYPATLDLGYGYFIKYRDVIYELSWIFSVGKDILFFFPKPNMKAAKYVIDFEDILNNKVQDNVELIDKKLDLHSNIIDENVSVEVVVDTNDRVFKRVLSKS